MPMIHVFLLGAALCAVSARPAYGEASISSSLIFRRSAQTQAAYRSTAGTETGRATITLRFTDPPAQQQLDEIESHGVTFARDGGGILHTATIYPASIDLDSLDAVAALPGLVRIEDSARPFAATPLDVSNPLVQASQVWPNRHNGIPLDGAGVVIVNVDTGIDIFNPAFFKPDGGTFNWIDVNENGVFDGGADAVDLNGNATADDGETLDFLDAYVDDAQHILAEVNGDVFNDGVYDADVEWLYNDANGNGERDYGPGLFTESSPCYGEQFFIVSDTDDDGELDPHEQLIGLGTSKVLAVYTLDKTYERGTDLIHAPGETLIHGTPAAGIVLGNTPGQRFVGMAPGAELISINRMELSRMSAVDEPRSVEAGIIWATNPNTHGARIVMHEFGSWVGEFLDGTSNYETMIKEQVATGINHFTASGNLAGPTRKKHAAFEIATYEDKTLGFTVAESNHITAVYISILWRSTKFSIGPSISLRLSDGTTRVLNPDEKEYPIGTYTMQSWHDWSTSGTNRYDLGLYATTNSPEGILKGDFYLDIDYRWTIQPQLDIDAYITDNATSWEGGAQFVDYVTDDGTVTAPGTAINDVTVGAYSPRGNRSRSPIDTPGAIGDFSGWGRTIDGRIAVDITAPGFNVFSPKTFYSSDGLSWGYTDFNGTSAALPFVTGCAALILQAAPGTTPSQLAQVLYDGALVDSYVTSFGAPPNDTWGYGKLHIYDSLVESSIVTLPVITEDHPASFTVTAPYPNPFNTATRFEVILPEGTGETVECQIYNMLGQTVRKLRSPHGASGLHSFVWDGRDAGGNSVATGIYLFSITVGRHTQTARAVFLK